uniref:Acetyltransferase n=1 Tax=Angiostrongylus cantonensis TaxID=6313 RepID=A0A0K0DGK3_ANGCA
MYPTSSIKVSCNLDYADLPRVVNLCSLSVFAKQRMSSFEELTQYATDALYRIALVPINVLDRLPMYLGQSKKSVFLNITVDEKSFIGTI